MADHAEPESDAGVKQVDGISQITTVALENVSILEKQPIVCELPQSKPTEGTKSNPANAAISCGIQVPVERRIFGSKSQTHHSTAGPASFCFRVDAES
ncbi:hypothetical protein PV05_01624 [Exophiala xenobiotica]|uniref:Uncharacterized protein n=1 Tax=Exophiala xenobiotica TaxID=348802 RepID=A0A0D2DGW0_9EURO|nr:uncharacterized protein PV05_01624 [Exophiala xenobiotica]KIW61512.1 hypothetical protein PV05_01624 [Exophiala xenobiotica]